MAIRGAPTRDLSEVLITPGYGGDPSYDPYGQDWLNNQTYWDQIGNPDSGGEWNPGPDQGGGSAEPPAQEAPPEVQFTPPPLPEIIVEAIKAPKPAAPPPVIPWVAAIPIIGIMPMPAGPQDLDEVGPGEEMAEVFVTAPPAKPPTLTAVGADFVMPPNWWQLGQGFAGALSQWTPELAVGAVATGWMSTFAEWLLKPGNLKDGAAGSNRFRPDTRPGVSTGLSSTLQPLAEVLVSARRAPAPGPAGAPFDLVGFAVPDLVGYPFGDPFPEPAPEPQARPGPTPAPWPFADPLSQPFPTPRAEPQPQPRPQPLPEPFAPALPEPWAPPFTPPAPPTARPVPPITTFADPLGRPTADPDPFTNPKPAPKEPEDETCVCEKRKPPQPKPPRAECREGTYRQLAKGIVYRPLRIVPCESTTARSSGGSKEKAPKKAPKKRTVTKPGQFPNLSLGV